jgi:regulator of sigma D
MTDFTFLPAEATEAKHDIVQALYQRLKDVRRAMNVRPSLEDEFELGIDCRLANEVEWLESLLEKIERS